MKLFFDARYIRTDFHDGVSRYSTELANELSKMHDDTTFIISDDKQRDFLPVGSKTVLIHPTTSWKEPFSAFYLNKYHPDVVATPLQTMGSFGKRYKLILNQQDTTYYKLKTPPAHLSWYVRLTWRLYHTSYLPGRLTLNAADMVATVSETSKKEIEQARLTKRPIIVVPNAARNLEEYLTSPIKQARKAPHNLIYMGAFFPHKNVETLIKMLDYLPNHTLHLLSRISDERKAELQALVPYGHEVVFHGGVSDEQYAQLLAHDAIMVSATYSEGFNLNLAEALKAGVPCVVSDLPVHHEVAGRGALFADPYNPADFAEKIESLNSLSARAALVEKGKHHVEKFTWKKSAKVLLDAARELAS